MTKAIAKSPQCKPADHMFVHVETTPQPAFSGYSNQLGGLQQYVPAPARVFKLYCSKCGEVRGL